MKITTTLTLASLTAVVMAGAIATPALAAQPKGSIKKLVQNQTTNSQLVDADTKDAALNAKPGDVLKFVVRITNDGDGPMHFTRLVDTLPSGIELVNDPSMHEISQDLGTIEAHRTASREIIVRVTSTTGDDIIENKACFTGNDESKQAAQNGCDTAIAMISSAAAPVPEQPIKPQPQAPSTTQPAPRETLPVTGPAGTIISFVAIMAGIAYSARMFFLTQRER